MKKLVKKIGQNKFQFFFFVGMLALLVVALVIAGTTGGSTGGKKPTPDPDPDPEKPVITDPVEEFKTPLNSTNFKIVRKFYEKDGTKEDQELSLIKYQNTYRTSKGTSYAKEDGTSFDVISILSGKVIEIKESPLYGNYVVIEHKDGIKSTYYGLSEVNVINGAEVNQGDKIGVSGTTEIDKEAGNHVYLTITKNGKHYNPEKLIGKKINEV